jgi:regulatory protein YycH of two-component signal transduction system YycFG
VNWEEVRTKQQGVEIRFRDGIPFTILQQLLRIEGELPIDNDKITRIWIYSKGNNEDVRAFFFTDSRALDTKSSGLILQVKMWKISRHLVT